MLRAILSQARAHYFVTTGQKSGTICLVTRCVTGKRESKTIMVAENTGATVGSPTAATLKEDEFVEKHERLRLALSATGLGTWDMDLVNNRRHWSTETFALHGLATKQGAHEHVDLNNQIMHPDDRERLKLLHEELRAGRDDYTFEYRTTLPDGAERWILARGKVLTRNKLGPTRIVGVSGDITARKQQQIVQDYNEAQFRLLADSLPQLVWIANAEGQVTYYNARRDAYFNDGNSHPVRPQWQPLVHAEDLPHTMEAWKKAMDGGGEYEAGHRLKMANGSFRWHLSRATPVRGKDGTAISWFGTATDIDGLKQAEARIQAGAERLQIATEAASMFSWEMNFKSETMTWADNAVDVIGCATGELSPTPSGGNFFVHADDRARILAEFDDFWKNGSDRFEMKFRGVPRHGRPMFWRTAGKFIRDQDNQPERAVGITQDVTHLLETAAQVKLLDERLAAAEEGSGALVYDYNVAEDHIWRSNGLTRILGWGKTDVGPSLASWRSLMHPDDAAKLHSPDPESVLDDNDHYALEYRIRHKDGGYRWMMDAGQAYRDANGKIIRQAGTTIDITSRKLSERTQNRMASLIELSFEPILVWHSEHGILDWNRGAEILYGFTREKALGQKPQDLLKTRYPLGMSGIMQQLRVSPSWSGEIENTAQDGSIVVVESRYQLIELDGELVVLETNRDTRERKRADANLARIAAVAAASHDALYGSSLKGIIETWNPGAEQLFGYSQSEALGQHISMLADPKQQEEQLRFLGKVTAGEIIKPFDTVRKTKDGRLIDVSKAMSPVFAPDGSVMAVSVALHDISERKEWDKRQRLMNRELAHRVKNSFAILQAIMRSTLKTKPDPEQFAAAFSGRLHSMAAAHDVLTENDWRGAELGALLRHQLSHYVTGQRIHLTGGIVNLAAEHAAPLSLIFNELATNGVKYGALSTPLGRIDIGWQIKTIPGQGGVIELGWVESGGPVITSTGPRGFGSTLIERSFAGAEVHMRFPPEGMVCTLSWPILQPAT
jgi:PAS domain S-box-containing protein